MIKGVVCGYRIEEISEEFALYRDCRRMEKTVLEFLYQQACIFTGSQPFLK